MLPHILQLRPTAGCPPKCQTCNAHIKSNAPDLSLQEIENNIDYFIKTYGIDELIFSGLEITLRKDFLELTEMLRKKQFKLVTLFSSGLHWTPKSINACVGIIDRVVIALSPVDENELKDPFGITARILRNIKLLTNAGIKVETNTILQDHVLSILPCLTETLIELNLKNPTLTFPFALGSSEKKLDSKIPSWAKTQPIIFEALDKLESLNVRLKNVPLCLLGKYKKFTLPTTQRFLVEPKRQLEKHAIIPPFVGLTHNDACTTCSLVSKCDGFWPAYVSSGLFPEPITMRELISA